jgi:Abortive infection alpha
VIIVSESATSGNDPATAFAVELARKLPVEAVFSPAAEPAGQILADVLKTIQLALAPIQIAGAFQDRLRNFIDSSIRRVPDADRVAPAPQILGPVLEGIRYEPEGTPVDEMFSELLSRSMDRDRVNEAHPAYPYLIKQLSSDEAKVLRILDGETFALVYGWGWDDKRQNIQGARHVEFDDFPRAGLSFPTNLSFYMEHLNQLGLAVIEQTGEQERVTNSDNVIVAIRIHSVYRLTNLGSRFMRACSKG